MKPLLAGRGAPSRDAVIHDFEKNRNVAYRVRVEDMIINKVPGGDVVDGVDVGTVGLIWSMQVSAEHQQQDTTEVAVFLNVQDWSG